MNKEEQEKRMTKKEEEREYGKERTKYFFSERKGRNRDINLKRKDGERFQVTK